MRKTTKKDFELYKKECQKWIDFFGLKEWRWIFEWKDLENNNAECKGNCTGMIMTLKLGKRIDVPAPILAFHEVLHALLWDWSAGGYARFIAKEVLEEEEEKVVRRLEKLLPYIKI